MSGTLGHFCVVSIDNVLTAGAFWVSLEPVLSMWIAQAQCGFLPRRRTWHRSNSKLFSPSVEHEYVWAGLAHLSLPSNKIFAMQICIKQKHQHNLHLWAHCSLACPPVQACTGAMFIISIASSRAGAYTLKQAGKIPSRCCRLGSRRWHGHASA